MIKKVEDFEYVYFIYNDSDELIYIGKTNNLKNRLSDHGCLVEVVEDNKVVLKFKKLENVKKVEYIEVLKKDVFKIEANYISYYKPKHNKSSRKKIFDISVYNYEFKIYDLWGNSYVSLNKDIEVDIMINKDMCEIYEMIEFYSNLHIENYQEYIKYNIKDFNLICSLVKMLEDIEWLIKQNNRIIILNTFKKHNLISLNYKEDGIVLINFPHYELFKIKKNKEESENKFFLNKFMNKNKIKLKNFKKYDTINHTLGFGVVYNVEDDKVDVVFENDLKKHTFDKKLLTFFILREYPELTPEYIEIDN